MMRAAAPQHNAFDSGTSLFRNAMLLFKARFETFQIYWNPRLRIFRSRPKILHGPCDGLVCIPSSYLSLFSNPNATYEQSSNSSSGGGKVGVFPYTLIV
jgi:hypothetical protein